MSYISNRKLKDEVSKQLFELPFSLLGKRGNREEFQQILFSILSPTEQTVIAKRIAVLYLLVKKIDYLAIMDVLKVSTSTVSKCNLMLESNIELKNTLQILARNEQMKNLFKEVFSDIYAPGAYGINWKNAAKRKREIERVKKEGI